MTNSKLEKHNKYSLEGSSEDLSRIAYLGISMPAPSRILYTVRRSCKVKFLTPEVCYTLGQTFKTSNLEG
jgi:hypothetical protein